MMIFVPTLFEEHWSCYALEPKDKILYLLVSIHDKFSTSKKNLDGAMKRRFEELLVLMNLGLTKENASITLLHVDKEILKFQQSLIGGWVQHPKNEVREEFLKAAGLWGKLC
ncbi:hypothetical protein HKD37_04G010130 [Glycine soja]